MQIPGFSRVITGLFNWLNAYPKPYTYHVGVQALQSNSAMTQALTIQADADFCITELACTALNAQITETTYKSGANANPYVLMQISDTGSGQTLFSSPVLIGHVGGQAGRDRLTLPAPYLVSRSATLNVTFTNLDVNTYDVHLDMIGVKLLTRTLGANIFNTSPVVRQ